MESRTNSTLLLKAYCGRGSLFKRLYNLNKEVFCKKQLAFSLPEVLITIGIIGVLVAVLMPSLRNAKPDQNEILHKKSTFILERVVNEISTDEFLYPANTEYTGLSNTDSVTVNGVSHSGDTKFCTLFASRLNRAPGTSINCKKNEKSITSVEGIDWYLPISDFKNEGFETIKIDVNGAKPPNCMTKSKFCYHPDTFQYQVRTGDKVPVITIEALAPTTAPAARPGMQDAQTPGVTTQAGQKWWCISCSINGPGSIFGLGCNKTNGNYQLVAIPAPGYKGTWFTQNVTVKDNDYTSCAVTFTPDNLRPGPDGGTVTPPPVTPPDPAKTYCINVTMTGDKTQCAFAGTGCGKAPGSYIVTASSKTGSEYKPSWTRQDAKIVDKDINYTLDCVKPDVENCYSITTTGDTVNCPVTLPKTTCKSDNTKYTDGTYPIVITPKPGYIYDGSPNAASKNIIVAGTNPTPFPVNCSVVSSIPLNISFTYGNVIEPYGRMWTRMTIEEPGIKPTSVDLVLGITKDSKVYSNQYSYPSGTKYTLTNFKSHYIANNVSSVEANQIFNSTSNFGVVYHNNKTYGQSDKVEGILNAATTLNFFLDTQGPPPPVVKKTLSLRSEMTLGDGLYSFPSMYCSGGGNDIVTLSGGGSFDKDSSLEINTTYHGSCYYDESKYKVAFVNWLENGTAISSSARSRIILDKDKILTARWKVSNIGSVSPPSTPTKCVLEVWYTDQTGVGADGRRMQLHYTFACTGDTNVTSESVQYNIYAQDGTYMSGIRVNTPAGIGNAIKPVVYSETLSYLHNGHLGTHYIKASTSSDYITIKYKNDWQSAPY